LKVSWLVPSTLVRPVDASPTSVAGQQLLNWPRWFGAVMFLLD